MPKLSEYVDLAATQYLQETGHVELDAHWIAEFFQDAGVLDDYPRQDLVAFSGLVQKVLSERAERAGKQTRLHLAKIRSGMPRQPKPDERKSEPRKPKSGPGKTGAS